MTIISWLKKHGNKHVNPFALALKLDVDIFSLDFKGGETNTAKVFLMERQDLKREDAIAALSMRQLMFDEEWNDHEKYDHQDIERWTKWLEKIYQGSTFYENAPPRVFKDSFLMKKLMDASNLRNIELNGQPVSYEFFSRKMEDMTKDMISYAKTEFTRLEEECYIETSHHFLLINWYTTA